ATRSPAGVRALVSVAPPALDPVTLTLGQDVAGFPAGDGELLRETDDGTWIDLSLAQFAGGAGDLPGDGAPKPDPVLGVAADPSGDHVWAVGGYAGTISASGLGTAQVLPARPVGWRTASVWRWDADADNGPQSLTPTTVSLPAEPATVSFAFFS